MIVTQLYMDNELRNFNYLVTCSETGETLAIDPFAAELCLQTAKDKGFEITHVLNTHEHFDHIGGNEAVIQATGAKLLAHAQAPIPGVDRGLQPGDTIKIGNTVEFETLDTPGHTYCHVCLVAHGDTPKLFSGDTLFNASCGNCHSGDSKTMYNSFKNHLFSLPLSTELYPGHDYIQNNLGFSLNREPDNQDARNLLESLKDTHNPHHALVTTLEQEYQFNPFFRLQEPEILRVLQNEFPDLDTSNQEAVFIALRACRDKW